MRKYLLNWGVLSTALGVVSVIQTTRQTPRDWRVLLLWASWTLSLVVVLTGVHDRSKDLETRS
jgi:steroid 5-alpha reductase family enzyme